MSDPPKAIFLSYASQDADVAWRLCDALRAAGLEVWFDQSELRGGDAWDASIRRQIKECALFVAVISANTQAREEGYFRREWNLAVNRTLDMADDKAFLLPVVIDATPDANARVPEKFRDVQWTYLPAGGAAAPFVELVQRLLSGGAASVVPVATTRAVPASATACAACGRLNPPSSKFCRNCGRGLEAPASPSQSVGSHAAEASRPPEAERRQITVLFCDLVGSTSLSHDLDPEDLRSAVRSFQDMAGEAIAFFEGYVAQYLGAGILVYFGYPSAHEDDARRAVSTGLRIVSGLPALNERLRRSDPGLRKLSLQVRVGVHTGLVVTGDIGAGARRDHLAIGETPDIATHMQGLAQPDTVLVSKNTYRLVEQLFELVPLGPRAVKGLAQPMRVYEARAELQDRPARSGQGPGTNAVAPLVGREQQVEMLRDRWQRVEQGHGHVLLVSGEAGIGKSRLARDLVEYVGNRPHVILEARFSPYHQQSPFHAVADLLLQMLGLGKEASTDDKLAGLERLLGRHAIDVAEGLPVLASILGLGATEMPTTMNASPEEQRQTIMESLLRILVGMAAGSPMLLIFEDLHWADPSTVELIGLLVGQVPTAPIFVVLTARPTFVQPWPSRTYATQLLLEPFTHAQTEQMVKQLIGGRTLPAEVLKQIIAKTDGVPLFAEELIKFVLEAGLLRESGDAYELAGPLPAMAIPSTLQDSLMARLDRLAPLKSLVQLAATLGREFSYALLRAVSPADDATLRRQLAGLVEAELIYQHGVPPQATYIFKHALIQDAAYQALLKSTRRQYHRHIAEVMAQRFPETVESQPEILAHHCTRAGLTGEAIDYWSRAGERALQRSAYPEAISHHSQALTLVADLPEGVERLKTELELQVALAPSLDATKGVSSPEAQSAYVRAWDLCQQVGDTPQTFTVLMGLRRLYFVSGNLGKAYSVAERLLGLSRTTNDPVHLIETHLAFGVTSFWRGEATEALGHLQRGMAYLDPGSLAQVASRVLVKMNNPLVSCLAYGSWALWVTGSPEKALTRSRQSIEYARTLDHPISMALALDFATALREFRGEPHEALALADEGIALCENHGFTFWLGLLTIRRGWALSRIDRAEEGLAATQAGIDLWKHTGAGLGKPFLFAFLAENLMRDNRIDEARHALRDAFDAASQRGDHFYEPEVHRLTGELHLMAGQRDAAARSLTRALDVANAQGAKSLALRAATSLARNWLPDSSEVPPTTHLAQCYGTFTEGFETPDLVQARALLGALHEDEQNPGHQLIGTAPHAKDGA